jgi:hypothetical protein
MTKKLMTGEVLDALSDNGIFELFWDGERFSIQASDALKPTTITPDELVELARELLVVAVSKGEGQ